jgi:hypothetical protein
MGDKLRPRTCENCGAKGSSTSDFAVWVCDRCNSRWEALIRQCQIVGAQAVLADDRGGEPYDTDAGLRMMDELKELEVVLAEYRRRVGERLGPNEERLYPTRPVKLGDTVTYDVAAPGTGCVEYVVTRIDPDGTAYGVKTKDTSRELEPWEVE